MHDEVERIEDQNQAHAEKQDASEPPANAHPEDALSAELPAEDNPPELKKGEQCGACRRGSFCQVTYNKDFDCLNGKHNMHGSSDEPNIYRCVCCHEVDDCTTGKCPKCGHEWNGKPNQHFHAYCCGCSTCGWPESLLDPFSKGNPAIENHQRLSASQASTVENSKLMEANNALKASLSTLEKRMENHLQLESPAVKALYELTHPAPSTPCKCKEKVTLYPPKPKAFVARETWCPKHGYDNDCYQCNPENISTELCIKHGTHGGLK